MSNDFAPVVAAYQAAEQAIRSIEADAMELRSASDALRGAQSSLDYSREAIEAVSASNAELSVRVVELADALGQTIETLARLEPDRLASVAEDTRNAVSKLEDAVQFIGTEQRDLGIASSAEHKAALESTLTMLRGLENAIRVALDATTEQIAARQTESTAALQGSIDEHHDDLVSRLAGIARRQVVVISVGAVAAVTGVAAVFIGLLR